MKKPHPKWRFEMKQEDCHGESSLIIKTRPEDVLAEFVGFLEDESVPDNFTFIVRRRPYDEN